MAPNQNKLLSFRTDIDTMMIEVNSFNPPYSGISLSQYSQKGDGYANEMKPVSNVLAVLEISSPQHIIAAFMLGSGHHHRHHHHHRRHRHRHRHHQLATEKLADISLHTGKSYPKMCLGLWHWDFIPLGAAGRCGLGGQSWWAWG